MDDGLDISKTTKTNLQKSPEKVPVQDVKIGLNADVQMSEDTRVDTERKDPPMGKKLVKVKKTRTFFDAKGFMVVEDYESVEEVDDVQPAKKQPAKVEKRQLP